MMDKKTYHDLKRNIKSMCRKNVLKLCDDMELNDEERNFLMYFYDGKTRVEVCMSLSISITYYRTRMKNIFEKIYDYKNTLI